MEPTTAPVADDATATTTPLIKRHFTTPDIHPFDEVEWEIRDAWPGDPQYENKGIEVPKSWSQQTLNIVSKLYLARGEADEEKSIRDMILRVVDKATVDGAKHGYFENVVEPDPGWDGLNAHGRRMWVRDTFPHHPAQIFHAELCYLIVHQIATFNSPVWFNIGRAGRPQCMSACFLLQVDDNSTSIMQEATDKAFVFRAGSGAGSNMSRIRGSMETLSTGGTASGPVSFRRVHNAVGETFKSGGTTRRAADMTQLDVDHPDIADFIECKVREEIVLRALADAGINIGFDREGERNVAEATSYQSSNHSVRVSDEFMIAATDEAHDGSWPLIARTTGEPVQVVNAKELLDHVAQAAWFCADPGLMYDDTINDWHTTPADGKLETTNACGEIHTPNVSSCNLAHLNILEFLPDEERIYDGPTVPTAEDFREFDTASFTQAVDVMTTAMDILICECELPTSGLTERTKQFRWLGLGYTNMGAAIMAQGMPYDSDEARDFVASVTALLTGRCYTQSAVLAERLGPFHEYHEKHQESMERVIRMHRRAIPDMPIGPESAIWLAAQEAWTTADHYGRHGYRNAQATAIAPTGTTSFMLGADTTGIEPAHSLVTFKELAGGGSMVLINASARRAAQMLGGYSKENLEQMSKGDFSSIAEEDKPIFFGAGEIGPEAHVKMVAAAQPFVSGGISKTINLAESAAPADIRDLYELGWKLKVKCLSVYRDNSKVRQILASSPKVEKEKMPDKVISIAREDLASGTEFSTKSVDVEIERQIDPRRRLPRTCRSVRHKIHIRSALGVEHEGYLHSGMYDDGSLGEIFIEGFGKSGGFTQNALGAWATDFSIALQYGVPMEVLLRKHAFVADETGGMVVPPSDKSQGMVPFRTCTSIVDYISRWLAAEFGDDELRQEMGVRPDAVQHHRRVISELKIQNLAVTTQPLPGHGGFAARVAEDLSAPTVVMSASQNGHAREHITGPPCGQCSRTMFRSGSCWTCYCGNTTGCG